MCEAGLDDIELRRAEQHFGLAMAPLWREVLRLVHPVQLPEPPRDSDGILRWTRVPDWRLRDLEATAFLVDGPVEGALFDVEYNEVWLPDWGARPALLDEALDVARAELGRSPLLTPLWNHLYAGPSNDSPVVSIVQTDSSSLPTRSLTSSNAAPPSRSDPGCPARISRRQVRRAAGALPSRRRGVPG
jgi:hypothetical protein